MNIFKDLFKDFNYKNISGLTNELKCIYINNFINKNDNSVLLVCNSIYEANKFYQALKNYDENILFFPMDDFLTSEVLAVSPEFKITRLETLDKLKSQKKHIVVTNLMGYLRFLPSKELFYKKYINLKVGDEIDINELKNNLYNIGYELNTIINKSGEIAVRGFVIDIFPVNYKEPIRIEFFGDEIESIRKFDIDSQLTVEKINSIEIIPNSEFIIEEDLPNNYYQRDIIKYGKVSSIKDYINNCKIFYNDYDDLKLSFENLKKDILEYSLSSSIEPNTKFMHELEDVYIENNINLCNNNTFNKNNSIDYSTYIFDEKLNNIEVLNNILKDYLKSNKTVVICVSNRYQANKIIDVIPNIIFTNENQIVENKINIIIKNISEGFIYDKYIYISENNIFNNNSVQEYKTNFKYGTRIKDITKLQIGDYIVHNAHGIGRYIGIKTISKNGLSKDYIQLEYKDGDKLYIPVEKIDLISKYSSGDGYVPKLNKLGSLEWEKTKIKARKRASLMAEDLLRLYALRESKEGFAFNKDDENQILFEKEFPYQETKDQIKVTEEIKKDMESPHPMDRLLCGDVGYGKTEVAFRAAFKAILSGKQVALLCPTTILSNQHFKNAIDRFKSFPVNIRLLNRFVSKKETNEIINDVQNGKVDLLIGTHKILNSDIHFKNLGLLIIDEEQRFGVRHKEKLKEIKNNIDVLSLSATPIPRTLQMSLSGIRGLSTLETPPENRYPIQTYVVSYNNKIIKDSIYKELSRNGQVFILYNKIEDMEMKQKEIQKLVPDAKIVCAHGRLTSDQIENIMVDFINKKYDVLLCTTIIETGIDIPNVNTLIVIDADRFGLSQLYQLRGRVGRTNKIAYCYLMYDPSKILNEIARKRLNVIKEFTELGSGLSIAMRDLSIRGAGDVLGSEQAGFVDSVGIELFMNLLKQEIDKVKGIYEEQEESLQPLIEVDTSVDDSYVKEEDLKIEIHKKINQIDSYDKLMSTKEELEDRFGKLSDKLIIYMYQEWFEHLANKLKIKKVNQTKDKVEIFIDKEILDKINGEKFFLDVLKVNTKFKFNMLGKNLIISLNINGLDKHFIYYLIDLLFVIEKAI
jgi:transcription-repair coupling factor (superfamily II helicase)